MVSSPSASPSRRAEQDVLDHRGRRRRDSWSGARAVELGVGLDGVNRLIRSVYENGRLFMCDS